MYCALRTARTYRSVLALVLVFSSMIVISHSAIAAQNCLPRISVSDQQYQNYLSFRSHLAAKGLFGIRDIMDETMMNAIENQVPEFLNNVQRLGYEFEGLDFTVRQELDSALKEFPMPIAQSETPLLPQGSCSATCLFNSCSVTCDADQIPSCYCSWGYAHCTCLPKVPTLSTWGMLLLVLLLISMGAWYFIKRKNAAIN